MAEDDLEPLITECPNCQTRFRVNETQLQVASGRVRCGACLTVFQGIDHLVWESTSEFANADEAKDALDALLDELDDAARPNEGPVVRDAPGGYPLGAVRLLAAEGSPSDAPPGAGAKRLEAGWAPEEWAPEARQLYVGHEDDHDAAAVKQALAPDQGEEAEAGAAEESALGEAPDIGAAAGGEVEASGLPAADEVEASSLPAADEVEASSLPAADGREEGARTDDALDTPQQESPAVSAELEQPEAEATASSPPAEPVVEASTDTLETDERPAEAASPPLVGTARELVVPEPEINFAPEPRRWWVGGLTVLGILALAAQIMFYQFESWSRDPTLRPLYAFACERLGCELPVLRDLGALRSEQLLVRSHPRLTNALVVEAIIVNGASFAQPFPELELRFTTVQGELVAGRRFQPQEYLAGELTGATMMPPRTPVRLELAIDDPGGDAVNYTLTFR